MIVTTAGDEVLLDGHPMSAEDALGLAEMLSRAGRDVIEQARRRKREAELAITRSADIAAARVAHADGWAVGDAWAWWTPAGHLDWCGTTRRDAMSAGPAWIRTQAGRRLHRVAPATPGRALCGAELHHARRPQGEPRCARCEPPPRPEAPTLAGPLFGGGS